ncbi:hypothetical protein M378DRAFT_127307 [Amanita muscaria Koide BX008]|uniref:FAD-binding FR-type domain-containing protein n=1 Tax=Amanita muscaria (strain Koide BX008) TaxID=946122 RepID=A0A0C2TAS6_AMAMK|nr:hypothetical protein M378DRAFT_127307 [Amanita muscaria Koide BX008]
MASPQPTQLGTPTTARQVPAWQLASELTQTVVVNLDIFICAALGLAILLRLPRGLGRFWKSSEWLNGHILRGTKVWKQDKTFGRPSTPLHRESSTGSKFSARGKEDIELESWDNIHIQPYRPPQQDSKAGHYPPHITTCPSALWPLSNALYKPIFSQYSNIQVLIMLAYATFLAFAFAFRSNPFQDPNRGSFLAVAQLPFLFAFSTRNNVIGWLMGLGFQHFNYLHRFLGRFIVLVLNVHAFCHMFRWFTGNEPISFYMTKSNVMGLLALACTNVIFIFSASYFRKKAYNIFLTTHSLYIILLPAIYIHAPSTLPFLIALTIPLALDRILRIFKTQYVTATIRPLPRLNSTRIEIAGLNAGWRPGQYVRVRVLSTSLGWFRWLESHPFTISTTAITDGLRVGDSGVVLICKKSGTWTRKLFDAAARSTNVEAERHLDGVKSIKVLIEGPYGGPGHAIYSSYSAAVLIAGGSGITFALSVIQDLVQKELQGQSRVKAITLVWVVQKLDALTELLPLATQLTNLTQILSIDVHYTRARQPPSVKLNRSESTSKKRVTDNLPTGTVDPLFPEIPRGVPISLHVGRPNREEFKKAVEGTITRAVGKDIDREEERRANGVLVGVCGPTGMGKEVKDAVHSIHMAKKYHVGGIDVHEEIFGW